MLVCLDRRRSIRFLCFLLEKTMLESNFSAMETICCSVMHVCVTHLLVRVKLDTSPRRESTSRSVQCFCELFQVVDMIFTKSARFVSGILMVRPLALMHMTSWVRICEHVVSICTWIVDLVEDLIQSGLGEFIEFQCCKPELVLGAHICQLVDHHLKT